jgi:uncharacterized OB-fold protein
MFEIMEDPLIRLIDVDDDTASFLAAAERGAFQIKRCVCGLAVGPMAKACAECGSDDLVEDTAAGQATLVSWTLSSGIDGPEVVLGIGRLREGVWWWARIADVNPASLVPGAPLRVDFRRPLGGGHAIPIFVLDQEGAA